MSRWRKLCSLKSLNIGSCNKITFDNVRLIAYVIRDKVYVIKSQCHHKRYPLYDGKIQIIDNEPYIICPWHNRQISLNTGKVSNHDDIQHIYNTKIVDDDVLIEKTLRTN